MIYNPHSNFRKYSLTFTLLLILLFTLSPEGLSAQDVFLSLKGNLGQKKSLMQKKS